MFQRVLFELSISRNKSSKYSYRLRTYHFTEFITCISTTAQIAQSLALLASD